MTIIDLTLLLTHGMSVFPGDPEVVIKEIHTLDKEGWRLRELLLTTHLGTHLNVPSHMVKQGKTLDAYELSDFIGRSVLFEEDTSWDRETGLIFTNQNIDQKICETLVNNPPKFIGLSQKFEFEIELEKKLLEHNIISYENLANTDQLPNSFTFYGIPLNMPGADGSPVRAFAVI